MLYCNHCGKELTGGAVWIGFGTEPYKSNRTYPMCIECAERCMTDSIIPKNPKERVETGGNLADMLGS